MSTTYLSTFISFVAFGLPFFGIEVTNEETLGNTIQQIVGVCAILYTFYGRWRVGGISAFGLRKKTPQIEG